MNPYKLMIIDDDNDLVDLLKTFMERQGFVIESATSGEEALIKYDRFLPQIIILDLELPEMDGFEICRILREEKESKATIIILSASESVDDMGRAFNMGATDFIIKSFETDGQTILDKIRSHLPLDGPI